MRYFSYVMLCLGGGKQEDAKCAKSESGARNSVTHGKAAKWKCAGLLLSAMDGK